MKKILISLSVIGVVAAIAVGGTIAYFSDTETSAGNTFTAGTLDLKVGNQDDPNIAVILDNVKPGDTKYEYWTLKNSGSIAGKPYISFGSILNKENGCTDPERDLDASCDNPGDGQGELGSFLYTQMYWRQGSDSWHQIRLVNYCGDPKLNALGAITVGKGLFTGCGIDPAFPVLNTGDELQVQFRTWWDGRFSTPVDNKAQGDSSIIDVTFHLDQAL